MNLIMLYNNSIMLSNNLIKLYNNLILYKGNEQQLLRKICIATRQFAVANCNENPIISDSAKASW